MEILRTGSIGSNFTGSYKKRVYLHYQYLWLPDLPCWRLTFRGSYHIVTWHLIKWPYLDYVTVWTFYISAFSRLMATNLGRMLTTGRRFSMQTLKSSLTCVFFLGMLFALMLICRIFCRSIWAVQRSGSSTRWNISLVTKLTRCLATLINTCNPIDPSKIIIQRLGTGYFVQKIYVMHLSLTL